jgi:hypothetical protein
MFYHLISPLISLEYIRPYGSSDALKRGREIRRGIQKYFYSHSRRKVNGDKKGLKTLYSYPDSYGVYIR